MYVYVLAVLVRVTLLPRVSEDKIRDKIMGEVSFCWSHYTLVQGCQLFRRKKFVKKKVKKCCWNF